LPVAATTTTPFLLAQLIIGIGRPANDTRLRQDSDRVLDMLCVLLSDFKNSQSTSVSANFASWIPNSDGKFPLSYHPLGDQGEQELAKWQKVNGK